MQETQVRSLDWEDSLEKGMATHYPLQYSCLENSTDRGAWRATVHGVAKDPDMTERLTHTQNQDDNSLLGYRTD